MTQRYTAWLPVLLLAAFTALTFWLEREIQPADPARNTKARHDPDYIVENFLVTRIGADGTPRHTLSAQRMVHFPNDDTTVLELPKLVSLANSTAAVTVTAKHATLSSDGENAYLTDDVRLVRAAYANNNELTVRTSYLHVIPDADLAKTDRPVEISDTHTLITSVGLEFNGQTRILKLLSNVRSTYEKPKPAR